MALGDSDEVFGGFFGLKDWIWWIFVAELDELRVAQCAIDGPMHSMLEDWRTSQMIAMPLSSHQHEAIQNHTADQMLLMVLHFRTISISGLEGRTSFLPILEDRIGKRESHSLTRVTQLDSSNTFYSSQYSDDSHFSPISSPPNTSDPASKRKSARSSSKLSLLGNVHCGLTTTLGDRISTLRAAYFNGTHSTCPTEFSRSGSRSFDEELKAVKELTSSRTKALELLLEEVSDFESKQQSGSTATPSPAIGDFTNTVNGNRKQHPTNVEAELITVVSSYDENLDHFDIIL
ncbi:unnamed protein product [Albugo candida]|uniref:Uncharacterized protein n=1 Tax=Albugo candida TaxID=65357 RepID=A0A024GTM5_9STRA|nr:unnamed protein product [Albugo candida]|eukprot:CCI49916.1 unnamed protein product [Albugo candida]